MRHLLTIAFLLVALFTIACKNDNSSNIFPTFTLLHRSLDDQSKAKEEEKKEEKEEKEEKIDPNAELAKKYSEAVDYLNPITRDYAAQIAALSPGAYNFGQICEIYDFVYRKWRYVSDPMGVNYISPASRTILANLVGDCDDYAVFMAAVIAAIGGGPSIILAWNEKSNSCHAYPEVFVGDKENFNKFAEYIFNRYRCRTFATPFINYHKNLFDRYWLTLDWNAPFPGGPFFESTRGIRIFLNGAYEKIN